MFHEDLNPLGLRIQSRLRVLICTHCETVLLPKSVARHFAEHHKHLNSIVNEQVILEAAKVWQLVHEMPQITGPVIYFQGLSLMKGCVKCPHCPRVFSKSTMPSHHSTTHPGITTPSFDKLLPIYAQRLNNGQHKSLFEVIVPSVALVSIPTDGIVEHLRISRDNLIPEYFPQHIDPRALSSWMKYTGWHAYVAPHPNSQLIALTAMPQKDEAMFVHIKAAVTSIFDTAYENISNTNLIVLQRLKTNDLKGP